MFLIADYAPQQRSGGFPVDTSRLNATDGYLRHYEHLLTLQFFHTHGTLQEKLQAAEELVICERKLRWWSNLPQFNAREAATAVLRLKQQWAR